MSTLDTLEKWTRAWPQAEREALGREFGIEWTALRYQGTGSMEGLEFLYPFLNDSDAHVRRLALRAAADVFRATGSGSLEKLTHITENRDLFIRDRSVAVVGSALVDEPEDVIREVLVDSYSHSNAFIQGLGIRALGLASAGKGWKGLLPLFADRVGHSNGLVPAGAVQGLGLAYSGTGDADALACLDPLARFLTAERHRDESRLAWHFRWRLQQGQSEEAVGSIARIGRGSEASDKALAIVGRFLNPEAPEHMAFEGQLAQREGVWAATSMLQAEPDRALEALGFLLQRPGPGGPQWTQRVPRSAAIWSLPGCFRGSGRHGLDAAERLLANEGHPSQRSGLLALGLAASGLEGSVERVSALLGPYLTHGNGALRDAANIAAGFAFQGRCSAAAFELVRTANSGGAGAPSTNYPLAVGLLYQGAADESVVEHLAGLLSTDRRRLRHHILLGIGLIYQGTGAAEATERIVELMEGEDRAAGAGALLPVDFTRQELADVLPEHSLADGPGAGRMFVLQHYARTAAV